MSDFGASNTPGLFKYQVPGENSVSSNASSTETAAADGGVLVSTSERSADLAFGPNASGDDDQATTLAAGEEDSGAQPPGNDEPATTLAVGEEDGGAQPPADDGQYFTQALGESDGGIISEVGDLLDEVGDFLDEVSEILEPISVLELMHQQQQ